jgi:hypothetical protein
MTATGRRLPAALPPLPVAIGLVLLAPVAALRTAILLLRVWSGHAGADFGGYYAAAQLGLARGWAALYDVRLYTHALFGVQGAVSGFANLPLAAWIVLPLSLLPLGIAARIWLGLLAIALLWTWRAGTAALGWPHSILLLLCALASAPVMEYALDQGQLTVLVAALLVLHWRLLRAGRPVAAGIVLGLALVKPQITLLAPIALLLSGRRRAALASLLTAAATAMAVVAALGAGGLRAYQASVAFEMGHSMYVVHTLGANLPAWAPAPAADVVVISLALLPSLTIGSRRYEVALASAVLGGLLVTPYLNEQDLTAVLVCAWLLLSGEVPAGTGWAFAASFPVFAIEDKLPPVAMVDLELAWLVALGWLAATRARGGGGTLPAPPVAGADQPLRHRRVPET